MQGEVQPVRDFEKALRGRGQGHGGIFKRKLGVPGPRRLLRQRNALGSHQYGRRDEHRADQCGQTGPSHVHLRVPVRAGPYRGFCLKGTFLVSQGRLTSTPSAAQIAQHIDITFIKKALAGGCPS